MGQVPWPSGTLFNQSMSPGQNHVWHFKYFKVDNGAGDFNVFDSQYKYLSLSLKANDFTLEFPCQITQLVSEHPIKYGPKDETSFAECAFEDGKTYYLNIKNIDGLGGTYTIVTS